LRCPRRCLAIALAAPLELAGARAGQEAAALFLDDLAQYRAAASDLRSAPLVAAARPVTRTALSSTGLAGAALSPLGVMRAVARNLAGIPQGGSTIPQQLAKLYLREGPRAGVLDKLSEALFATWLVRQAGPRRSRVCI